MRASAALSVHVYNPAKQSRFRAVPWSDSQCLACPQRSAGRLIMFLLAQEALFFRRPSRQRLSLALDPAAVARYRPAIVAGRLGRERFFFQPLDLFDKLRLLGRFDNL